MRKKAILNIENKDNNNCFMWAILRFRRPINLDSTRINDLKQYENHLNFKGIDFPVKVKDITKSEKQNSNIPKVNVLLMKKIKSTHLEKMKQIARTLLIYFCLKKMESLTMDLTKIFQD